MENDEKEIKVTPYSNGEGAKIDIYSPDSRTDPHDSIHIKFNTETGEGKIIEKDGDKPREETDIQCYLTTACMRKYTNNFDDQCYELTILRKFRDMFVSEKDIEHYYDIAPTIVEAINKIPYCDRIYHYIYDNVIRICVKAIEEGNYDFAYQRYKNSVLALEQEFVVPMLEDSKRMVLTK